MAVEKELEWVPVDCVFTTAAYRAGSRQLYLRFHNGDIYRYFEFPLRRYKEFLAADSKGRYFSQHIRSQFRYEQVRRGNRVSFVKPPSGQAYTR